MWLPGYKPPEHDWRESKRAVEMSFKRPTKEQRQAQASARKDFSDRAKLAREARERGASKEEIRLLMEA